MERQVNNINEYLNDNYESFDIVTDIGSVINYNKPSLLNLIEKINRKVIVVLHKDRLLRFGFELVEHFSRLNNVKIEELDKVNKT